MPHWFKDARCALVFEVVYTSKGATSSLLRGGGRDGWGRDRRDEENESRGIMGSRDDQDLVSDVVVATGIFLPFDGTKFEDHVDTRRTRNDYSSSAGSSVVLAPGAIFSSNGLVPQLSDVVDSATDDDAGRGDDSPDRSRGRRGRDDSSSALIPRRDSSPSMVRLVLVCFLV